MKKKKAKPVNQQKITDYIDDTPLLTPNDIEWQKQHQAKVKSGKKGVRGTDPTYQHMLSYPVTLSSKQAVIKQLYDARNGSKSAITKLSPVVFTLHKKRSKVN
jgi:hypothetical protein